MIRRLQAELRTEEMRLVLLKKIRQSQILAAAQQQQQIHPTPTIELKTGKFSLSGRLLATCPFHVQFRRFTSSAELRMFCFHSFSC